MGRPGLEVEGSHCRATVGASAVVEEEAGAEDLEVSAYMVAIAVVVEADIRV